MCISQLLYSTDIHSSSVRGVTSLEDLDGVDSLLLCLEGEETETSGVGVVFTLTDSFEGEASLGSEGSSLAVDWIGSCFLGFFGDSFSNWMNSLGAVFSLTSGVVVVSLTLALTLASTDLGFVSCT